MPTKSGSSFFEAKQVDPVAWAQSQSQGTVPVNAYSPVATAPVIQPVLPQQNNIQDMINQMKQAQISAITGKLDTAKNNALSGITNRRNTMGQEYQGYKNNASTQGYMAAKNFAEYMANRGTGAGTQAQASLLNGMGVRNNTTKLDMAKAQETEKLASDEALINQNYNSDLVSAQSGIESDAMRQAIAAQQQAQAQAIEQQKYNQQQSWLQKQFESSQAQQNLENQLKQQQYENALKQQEFENQMAMQQFALAQAKSSNGGGGGSRGGSGSSTKDMTPSQVLDYQRKQLEYYKDLWQLTGKAPGYTESTGPYSSTDLGETYDVPYIPGTTVGQAYPTMTNTQNSNYNAVLNRVISMAGNDNYDTADIQNYILSANITDEEAAELLNKFGN